MWVDTGCGLRLSWSSTEMSPEQKHKTLAREQESLPPKVLRARAREKRKGGRKEREGEGGRKRRERARMERD